MHGTAHLAAGTGAVLPFAEAALQPAIAHLVDHPLQARGTPGAGNLAHQHHRLRGSPARAPLVLHHADGTDAAPQVLHRPGAQQVFFQLRQRQRERTQLVGFGHQPLAALDDGIQPAPAEHGQNGQQRHRHQQLDEREAGGTAR